MVSSKKNISSIKQLSPIHKNMISDSLIMNQESPGTKVDILNIKKKNKSYVTKNMKASRMQNNLAVTNLKNDSTLNLPIVDKKMTAATNLFPR